MQRSCAPARPLQKGMTGMKKLGLLGSSAIGSAAFITVSLVLAAPAYAQTEPTTQDTPPTANATGAAQEGDATGGAPAENTATGAGADGSAAANEDEGDIVVTGSRIHRPNFETLQPAVVIDSQQIESRGFETLGQAINEQPSFGVPGASPVGGQAGSFGSGQSFVNFLGLGSQRTLTLINGRRFV